MNKPQKKGVSELKGAAFSAWLKNKNRQPIFTDSVEFEGMSLCMANPQLKETRHGQTKTLYQQE